MQTALEDRAKHTDIRVAGLEEKVESADVGAALLADKVETLEQQHKELREDIAYLKSQPMRNNLVFIGIIEDKTTGNEPADITEMKLRIHLEEKLRFAKWELFV